MPHKKICKGCGAEIQWPTEDEARIAFAHHDYKVGETLYAPEMWGAEPMVLFQIKLPTTCGSNAWLHARLKSVPPLDEHGHVNGGTFGAPDYCFTRTPPERTGIHRSLN